MSTVTLTHSNSLEALQFIVETMRRNDPRDFRLPWKIILLLMKCYERCFSEEEKDIEQYLESVLSRSPKTLPASMSDEYLEITSARNVYFWYNRFACIKGTVEACGFVLYYPSSETKLDVYVQRKRIVTNEVHLLPFMSAWNRGGKAIMFLSRCNPPGGSSFELSNANLYRQLEAPRESFRRWTERIKSELAHPQSVLADRSLTVQQVRRIEPVVPSQAPMLFVRLCSQRGVSYKGDPVIRCDEAKDFTIFIRNEKDAVFPFKHYTCEWTSQDESHLEIPPVIGRAQGKAYGDSAIITIPAFRETGRHSLLIQLTPRVVGRYPPLIGEFHIQVVEPTALKRKKRAQPPTKNGEQPPAKKRKL